MDSDILKGIIKNQRKYSILKELFRKTIHIFSAFVPILLNFIYWPTVGLLVAAAVIYTICQILMLKGIEIPLISKIILLASRKRDENRFVLGPLTLVFGIIIVSLLLPLEYARVGIWALAFGDGLASLVGKLVGRIVIPGSKGKTVAGSMACFISVYITVFLCCNDCVISFIIALIAMVVEVLPLLDFDNLIIPVIVSYAYYFLLQLFP